MLSFKKILCPTDFSEASYRALKIAKELALCFSSELYLAHIIKSLPPLVEIPPDRPKFNVSLYRKELKASAEKSLQEVIHKKIGKKLKVHGVVTHGDPANEIARIAKRENVELIVIATHGTTGSRRFLLGSVTEKVIRVAACSVLSIPDQLKKAH